MPLDKSGSRASIGKNIKTERAAGKPQKQAIAIALNTARRAGRSIPPGRNAQAAHRFDYLLPKAPNPRGKPKRPIRSASPKEERGEMGKPDKEMGEMMKGKKPSRGRLKTMLADAFKRKGRKEAALHNSMMG